MSGNWFVAIIPVVAFVVNITAQIGFSRGVDTEGPRLLRSIGAGFAMGLVCCLVLALPDLASDTWPLHAVNLVTYGALGYGYFHFINLGTTARRIRILRELEEAGGVLELSELLACYNAARIVERRLDRLLASGQILERDGRYYVGNPTVLWMARCIRLIERLLIGGQGSLADKDCGRPESTGYACRPAPK
jgi:hypothetical protein